MVNKRGIGLFFILVVLCAVVVSCTAGQGNGTEYTLPTLETTTERVEKATGTTAPNVETTTATDGSGLSTGDDDGGGYGPFIPKKHK